MDIPHIKNILSRVQSGEMSVEGAMKELKHLPYKNLSYARIDTHRALRTGFPEVIYCEGKDTRQIIGIVAQMVETHANIIATRMSQEVSQDVLTAFPDATYYQEARIAVFNPEPVEQKGHIAVVCAGTSDIPVAEEVCITAQVLGGYVTRTYDAGVAGIHRLLDCCEDLYTANVVVVVAGMEGALASVVGGLVSCPVIAVPTSVGYGASFHGITALLSMLNSCASGVSVVNIDNGFGAGYQATLINRLAIGASA